MEDNGFVSVQWLGAGNSVQRRTVSINSGLVVPAADDNRPPNTSENVYRRVA